MEIRKTLPRYLSILFIVALGVAFFSGVRASEPDMRLSADVYYDEMNFMDIRVISTLGLTDGDLEAIRAIPGVSRAEALLSVDAFLDTQENSLVAAVQSLTGDINRYRVSQGRLPEQSGECLLDEAFLLYGKYQIGDTITLRSGTDKPLTDSLTTDTYTITGFGLSPMYLSWDRGSATIGGGDVAGFVALLPKDFTLDVYSQIYVTADQADRYLCMTKEYENAVKPIVSAIETISGERCETRYHQLTDEPYQELAKAKQEAADGWQKINDARQELADAQADLERGEEQIAQARLQLSDAQTEIDVNERALKNAETSLDAGRLEYAQGEAEYNENAQKLADAQSQLTEARITLRIQEQELIDGKTQLETAKKQLTDNEAGYQSALARVNGVGNPQTDTVYGRELLKGYAGNLLPGSGDGTAGNGILDGIFGSIGLEDMPGTLAQTDPLCFVSGKTSAQAPVVLLSAPGQTTFGQAGPTKVNPLVREEFSGQTARAASNVTPGCAPESLSEESPSDTPEAPSKNPSGSNPEQSSENSPENPTTETPGSNPEESKDTADTKPEEPPKDTTDTSPEEPPKDITDTNPEEPPKDTTDTKPEEPPKDTTDTKPEEPPKDTTDTTPSEPPEDIPGSALPDLTPPEIDIPLPQSSWQTYLHQLYQDKKISEATHQQLSALTSEEVAELLVSYATVTAYEETLAAIAPLEEQIADGERQLNEGKTQLEEAQAELLDGQKQLEAGARELVKASVQIELAEEQIAQGRSQLADAKQQLKDGQDELEIKTQELKDGWSQFYRESAKAELELAEAEAELTKAEQDIAKAERELGLLENPQWFVLSRENGVQSYAEYNQDADRIGAVGEVFPVIFFLVAALVSLTTMTRMVEEQRTLIGTMKALGYSKGAIAAKYILYAMSASLAGSILGVLIGEILLPQVILSAYGMLYLNLPVRLTPLNLEYGLMATLIAVLCTTLATVFACFKELIAGPASLMRPAAPKEGKRVFLERISFLWSRLSFTSKSTVRNLFRYKKRFFMTVFGIGGCMALLMVGFGLRDSIHAIIKNQYRNIWVYDAYASVDDNASAEERSLLKSQIENTEGILEALEIRQVLIDVEAGGITKPVTLFVPQSTENLEHFIILRDRRTREPYELSDEGIIINEKLAAMLNLSAGDTITIKDGDTRRYTAVVSAVSENYLNNFLYMTPALYEELYGTEPVYNNLFLNLAEGTALTEEQLSERLLEMEHVTGVTLVSSLNEQVENMMSSLDLVVWVLIASAGLLAYVVLYNLNHINITERRRELATLKVLGFYDMEVAQYVYRENVLLTVFGCLFGILFGFFLHRFVILTLEVDMIMFGRAIQPLSYLLSIIITFLFAAFVNFIMYFSLKKIDMVESLKSVE